MAKHMTGHVKSGSQRGSNCSRGAAAGESPAHRILIYCLSLPLYLVASIHFGKGCASLGTWREKTLSLSGDTADGKLDRLPALAAELVRLKVDVIVTAAPPVTRAAKQATVTIPIVMAFDDDPVGFGVRCQPESPRWKITGLSTQSPEISGKQLEFLREIVPKLSRVGVLGDVDRPGVPQALREINVVADAFRVQLQYLEVRAPKDIETAFRAATKERADAVLVLGSPVFVLSETSCRPRGKEPASSNIQRARICRRWRAYDLRREHHRLVPARCHLRGQDPQRRQASRSPRRAAEEVRVHHQSQSSEANRSDDSAERAGASG